MSVPALTALCPAKVNLALRVVSRRPDGFHELDTVFQSVDLWDTLEIRPSDSLRLCCDDPRLPVDEGNLVLRAARALAGRCSDGPRHGAISLRKRIPVQAGLGGGSSDAAGALRLCDRFWSLETEERELERLAANLGSDVPFFLTGGTAHGSGRGDRVEALPFIGEIPLILGCPPFGIPTGEVFGRLEGRLTLPGNGVSVSLASAHKWPENNDLGVLVNDLEAIVFEGWPELESFRNALLGVGARGGLLSGSGSTVFGVFDEKAARGDALAELQRQFAAWRVISSSSVDAGDMTAGVAP